MKQSYRKIIGALAILLATAVLLAGCGGTNSSSTEAKAEYQYMTAAEVKEKIENSEEMVLLDIQVEEEWQEHHIAGSLPTHAYPVQSEEDKAKLDAVLSQLEGDCPIVIVCPRGGGGAERTYNYLKEKGIAEERLFILEKGMAGWPYEELTEKGL
ncbi:MAG: rhodanese-like domain-containing protein [Firmicutes bacterium]|nr:rhodanese-like domain-containing protein [Bacillota bacterium]